MTGHCAGQTGWDLAYGDKFERAFPATQCRPTPLGINILGADPSQDHPVGLGDLDPQPGRLLERMTIRPNCSDRQAGHVWFRPTVPPRG